MKRIALIGCGPHSQEHGAGLARLVAEDPSRIALVAVCDLDLEKAQRYRQRYGFARACTDMHAMVREEKPDGIAAITPWRLNDVIAAELVPYRLPMVIEKPPGETAAAAAKLRDLVRQHGTPHLVSFNRRFCAPLVEARRRIAGPVHVTASMIRINRLEEDFVIGTSIHVLDAAFSLVGRPTHVQTKKWAVGDTFHYRAEITCERGDVTCLLEPNADRLEETYVIEGAGPTMIVDAWNAKLDGKAFLPPEAQGGERLGSHAEMRAFLELVEGKTPVALPTMDDGVIVMVIAEMIERGESGDVTDIAS